MSDLNVKPALYVGGLFPEMQSEADLEAAQRRAERMARNREAAANALAVECIARTQCPTDLIEWGERHRIPEFAQATWQAGFAAGWRAFFLMTGLEQPAASGDTEEDAA